MKKEKKPQEVGLSKNIRDILKKDCACYVLITCSEPSEEGNMNVELQFEGDESLAALLIENANQVFTQRMEMK